MPFTILLLSTRKPNLPFAKFRDHYENTHLPLLKRFLGEDFPSSHSRHYIDKDGFYLLGSPTEFDPDSLAILEFESQEGRWSSGDVHAIQSLLPDRNLPQESQNDHCNPVEALSKKS